MSSTRAAGKQPKVLLFESSSDELSDDDTAAGPTQEELQASFAVKPQFEGAKGHKLLELQRSFVSEIPPFAILHWR